MMLIFGVFCSLLYMNVLAHLLVHQMHPCPVSAAYKGPLDLERFTEVSNFHFITATKLPGVPVPARYVAACHTIRTECAEKT